MFYVYLLKSEYNGSLCIGFAPDLRERFYKHNQGLVRSTKRFMPWRLVYYEAYVAKQDAVMREKQLKRFAKGFASLKGRLHNSLSSKGEG